MSKKPKLPPPCWHLFEAESVLIEPGHAVIRFRAQDEHENPYGFVQGGLLAAMMDNCIGPAVYRLAPDRRLATAEMKVSYLEPARSGDVLIGEARVIKHGRTVAFVEVTLGKEDGEPIATASATVVLLGAVEVPDDLSVLNTPSKGRQR